MALNIIYEFSFNKDVMNAANEASKLKMKWFKSVTKHEDVDKNVVLKYLGVINELLARYTDAMKNSREDAKGCSGPDNIDRAIPYADVKDFFYAKYDYAGILKFTEDMYKVINRGQVKSEDDIQSFFTDQVNKFFKGLPETYAAVRDDVLSIKAISADKRDIAQFNAVKSQNYFDPTERKEIYDSIRMTIDYVSNQINQKGRIDLEDGSMNAQITFINTVVDFMTYTLTAYMARVFIITNYLNTFILACNSYEVGVVAESVQDVSNKISDSEVDVIKSADEASLREPKDFENLADLFKTFTSIIGGSVKYDKDKTYVLRDMLDGNMFDEAALSNPLYEFINNRIGWAYFEGPRATKDITEFVAELKGYISNSAQALSTSISAKQELLPIIKLTGEDKKTKEGIQQVASQLADFSVSMLHQLQNGFKHYIDDRTRESLLPNHNLHMLNMYAELVKYIKELYEEIATTTLARFRDLEILYNGANNDELKNIMNSFKVKVPGDMKEEKSVTNTTDNLVPDTSRLPVDLHSLPAYESYRMYSEYARTIFPNDTYYSEAFDLSKLIDTLLSKVSGWFSKMNKFFDNDRFKAAVKWVNDNQGRLNSMTFRAGQKVLPYKANINYPSIDAFTRALGAFNVDGIKSQEDLDKFIDSLYDINANDQTFTKIIKSNDTNSGKQLENYVLFGVQPGTDVSEKTLDSSDAVKNEMNNIWISTVKSSTSIRQSLTTAEQQMKNTMQSVKSKIAGATLSNNANDKKDTAPDINGGDEEGTENPTNKEDNTSLLQSAVTRMDAACNKIVFPVYNIFHKAIVDQYNYIREAFQNAEK